MRTEAARREREHLHKQDTWTGKVAESKKVERSTGQKRMVIRELKNTNINTNIVIILAIKSIQRGRQEVKGENGETTRS